jgi:hypothetical protein
LASHHFRGNPGSRWIHHSSRIRRCRNILDNPYIQVNRSIPGNRFSQANRNILVSQLIRDSHNIPDNRSILVSRDNRSIRGNPWYRVNRTPIPKSFPDSRVNLIIR